MSTLIRYLGTSLLLFVLIIFLLTNSWLCISRARKNRHRINELLNKPIAFSIVL
ncbi:IgaA/UmoB family intracellular growth attenuator [Candidatus Regiella insecticola]|uniref:IgaA/UmoB family intracellular growth attenuator n=1 Tax=Candidatus Regiella insecticola TaxID=138073 RepID=UPI00159670FF